MNVYFFLAKYRLIKQVDGCPVCGPILVVFVFSDIFIGKMENVVVTPMKPIFYKI